MPQPPPLFTALCQVGHGVAHPLLHRVNSLVRVGDGTRQELSIGNIKFRAHDLGGHKVARKVWKDYYAKVGVCV